MAAFWPGFAVASADSFVREHAHGNPPPGRRGAGAAREFCDLITCLLRTLDNQSAYL